MTFKLLLKLLITWYDVWGRQEIRPIWLLMTLEQISLEQM